MIRHGLFASIFLFLSSISQAADWTLTPLFSPNVQYDDNVLMRSKNEQASLKYAVTPTIKFDFNSERANVGVSTGYSLSRYSSLSELDQTNPFFNVTGSTSTERSTLGVSVGYDKTASRDTAAEDTGNFSSSSVITSRSVSPNFSYQLTEKDRVSVSVAYSKRDYSNSEFSDNKNTSLSASWQRQLTERLAGNLSSTFSNYVSGSQFNGSENESYNALVGASYQLSEKWDFNGQVGVRYLDSDTYVSGLTKTNSSSGNSFNLSVSYKSVLDTVSLSSSKALNPSSTGDVNDQESFSLSWRRNLTETVSVSVTGAYSQTRSATEETTNKRENINISPSLTWQLSPRAMVNINYAYRQQKGDAINSAESNAFFIGINYDWNAHRLFQ